MKKNSARNFCFVAKHFIIEFLAAYTLLIILPTCVSGQTLSNINTLQSAREKIAVKEVRKIISATNVPDSVRENARTDSYARKREIQHWKDAAKFARENTEDFVELLDFYSKHMKANDLSDHFNTPSTKSIYYASLAVQKPAVLERYFSEYSFDPDGKERKEVEEEIEVIKSFVLKSSKPTASFFASGNIRNVATSKSTEPLAGGTGTIGISYSSNRHLFSAQVAVAATEDTIRSGFGANVLSPVNGKALKSGLLEWYPQITKNINNWLHFYGSFSSSVWDVDTTSSGSLTKSASVIGVGAFFHRRLFGGELGETTVGLDAEFGVSGRFLGGDVRNLLKTEIGKTKYLESFPSKRWAFLGLEGGFTLNFGQLVGAVQAYYLFPKTSEPIDGLSKLQISFGVSVRGDIIKDILN
ncbi:hypothetical protein [Chitinophaga tropicalis]|uniref:Uncharacterized protein n=1 Tax=Chitinophaga tropicalis TaxID=2683588 RepID=A0A7K1UD40_9BACT|nr:hypothetical protein [Chitinophaga tropicalis]MVT12291.1 hypothetical protein [Chitinophaga tropicalis]